MIEAAQAELTGLPATELAALIASRKVSATEAVKAHVDRIQARIDCLARNRDRLSAYLAAVRAEAGRP